MSRMRQPPRLALRSRSDGESEWIIRDGQSYRRTGHRESQTEGAERALRSYVAKVYGPDKLALLPPPTFKWKRHARAVDALMVYFIGDGRFVKIGIASNLKGRFKDIQAYCPQELSIYGTVAGGLSLERELHTRFAAHRERCEWFRIEGALLDYLRALPDIGLLAGFTAESRPTHSSARLGSDQVEIIRQNPAGLSGAEFTRLFGMSAAAISQAKTGVWWKTASPASADRRA